MGSIFRAQGRFIGDHPWIALLSVAALALATGAGYFIETGPATDQNEAFLPEGNELQEAQAKISQTFRGTADRISSVPVQIIIRGDVMDPATIQETLDLMDHIVTHPDVEPFLLDGSPAASYAHVILPLLGGQDLGSLDRDDVEAALDDARNDPDLAPLASLVDAFTARNGDAAIGAMAMVSLDGDADRADLTAVQLGMDDIIDDFGFGSADARSFSGAKLSEEIAASQGTSTVVLMGMAIGIIVLVLLLFYRNLTDVLVSLGGLILTVVMVFGVQGLLGPGGIGIIGGNNPMATMIPVLLIGLSVDYALQVTARYREHLQEGDDATTSMRRAVHLSGLPLLLAASTTAISFLTNLTSALPPMQDFGIIAAIGVMFGWFVMTTFTPAVRCLIDQRREDQGKRLQDRMLSDAIPGAGKVLASISGTLVRHPLPILAAVVVLSGLSFAGAANISTTFDQSDFLPQDTESAQDLAFISEHFAGAGTSSVTVLIEGDMLDVRMLTVLGFIQDDLSDSDFRPEGVTGPVALSFLDLITDWSTQSPAPGDNYDEHFAAFLQDLSSREDIDRTDIDQLHIALRNVDPDGYGAVMSTDITGHGSTIISFPIDPAFAESLMQDLERIAVPLEGFGAEWTATGPDLLSVVITQEMTDGQIQSIAITVAAALLVLVLYFGIVERRAMLGVIAVAPIALVVGWVLGGMFLLGISYNVLTALITALTIGVGVDYTIHVTHRFTEELDEGQGILHAVQESLRTTGGALLGSALTTALGFAVLVFSPLAPMQQFGGLTALTILYSLIAAFFVLPPMLVLWALFREWKDHGERPQRTVGDL